MCMQCAEHGAMASHDNDVHICACKGTFAHAACCRMPMLGTIVFTSCYRRSAIQNSVNGFRWNSKTRCERTLVHARQERASIQFARVQCASGLSAHSTHTLLGIVREILFVIYYYDYDYDYDYYYYYLFPVVIVRCWRESVHIMCHRVGVCANMPPS